jgi:hypothetical protein
MSRRTKRLTPQAFRDLRALVWARRDIEALSYAQALSLDDAFEREYWVRGECISVEINVLEREPDYVHVGMAVDCGSGVCPYCTSTLVRNVNDRARL